jgi:hypothetical protein
MFYAMSKLIKKLTKPYVAIPAMAAAGFLILATRKASEHVMLLGADHEPVAVRRADVYLVHISPMRMESSSLTRVHVEGLEQPLDVLETPHEVLERLGGSWTQLHAPGGWLSLQGGEVPVFVNPSKVVSVRTSGYRMVRGTDPLTDVQLVDRHSLRVIEPAGRVSRLLGL